MNWDNLIEQAARKLKKEIPKVNEGGDVSAGTHIWKFHGDVENLKQDNVRGKGGWVYKSRAKTKQVLAFCLG